MAPVLHRMSKLVVNTRSLQESIENNPNFMPTLLNSLQAGAGALQAGSVDAPALASEDPALASEAPGLASEAVEPNIVSEQPSDYMQAIMEERMHSMIENSVDH